MVALHLIAWKFILIHFTAVDMHGQRFIVGEVWKGTVRRLMSRIERMKVAVRCRAAKELGKGSSYKPTQENKMVAPLGNFDEMGRFRYNDVLWREIVGLGLCEHAKN